MSNRGLLAVISGPSGSGKDTVAGEVMRRMPDACLSVSATTREKREDEQEGVDYYYMTRAGFRRMIRRCEFVEYTQYCGNYYGTPRSEIERRIAEGRVVFLVIEVEGAGNIKSLFPDSVTIFISPPSFEELERRLRARGTDSEEDIERRLERAREEMKLKDNYDYRLTNDEVEKCAESIINIINKTRKAE